jgi:hypothetical protein
LSYHSRPATRRTLASINRFAPLHSHLIRRDKDGEHTLFSAETIRMPSSGAGGEAEVPAATVKATAKRSRTEVGRDGAMVVVVVVSDDLR